MSENTPGQYGQQGNQPAYGAGQAYPSEQNGNYAGPGTPQENPGKTLGIVGLVCSIIWPISIVGLIVSIVAMRKSKKAGMGNGLALAGIIIGAIGVITGIIAIIIGVLAAGEIAGLVEFCQTAGPGVQEYQGQQVDCSPYQQ
ncbi:DUF4190 domain-containing protein [Arthrobacter roseus]|uniref:DUF4190 domain-containing protein n=1 Tax=Arthrobacter roseus TaxID=136274 RepID=UPI00196265B9|nr:DUF4190 domain-containing protein [Arthrobacter roseus]MBM7847713.1 hypothetical protein [Arthrobacter roseus]